MVGLPAAQKKMLVAKRSLQANLNQSMQNEPLTAKSGELLARAAILSL